VRKSAVTSPQNTVPAYFRTWGYEKIHFYSLDALSIHGLNLPTLALETMAFWIVPPESLMETVRRAGLDAHSGLRGIGYATRMLLPLFMTCDTPDFSHSVGSVNSPWNAVFVYERYPRGLGFTEKAYEQMDRILPAVLDGVRACPCPEGCPCCVGKPLRQFTTWNVERGEASIPSKAAAIRILDGLLGDRTNLRNPDRATVASGPEAARLRLEQALRRRLERGREPQVFHPIRPGPELATGCPAPEPAGELPKADPQVRLERRRAFDRDLHRRIAKKLGLDGLDPRKGRPPVPNGMITRHGNLRPTDFPGRPAAPHPAPPVPAHPPEGPPAPPPAPKGVTLGDPLAARARSKYKARQAESEGPPRPEPGGDGCGPR